ncbi:hypothetical protein BKA62DRAFT_701700 [Auriculariales sp. MPI-PUGE-AT-0066]|nr:hypothetical protein BKA62DRAFT_701700 [Auriculariales sp. MPI-PUGE-AT-0066]
MAHFYEASTMCTWALQELVTLLPMSNLTDVAVLKRLYVFATDADQRLCQIFKEYWLQLVESSADPVEWLIAAKDIRDEYLQAHAYFHILKKTNAEIRAEPRLSTIDKLRLNIGTTNLRRYQVDGCGCVNPHYYGHICGHTQDPDQWSPKTRAPLQANYGTLSLWDMFTRSPMGFDLTDGVELVMPGAKWGES